MQRGERVCHLSLSRTVPPWPVSKPHVKTGSLIRWTVTPQEKNVFIAVALWCFPSGCATVSLSFFFGIVSRFLLIIGGAEHSLVYVLVFLSAASSATTHRLQAGPVHSLLCVELQSTWWLWSVLHLKSIDVSPCVGFRSFRAVRSGRRMSPNLLQPEKIVGFSRR